MVSRIHRLRNYTEVLFAQQLQNVKCAIPCVIVRYGTKKCTLRVGKYTWWLKTYIAQNVLLEKLNRTAGVIRDSVPSRCDLR